MKKVINKAKAYFYFMRVFIFSIFLPALLVTFPGKSANNIDTIVVFEHLSHDFGKIHEEEGPAIYRFSFINNGRQPVVITDVKASCGCTTPSWTKDTVPPNGEGYVAARFNPHNRPGAFQKKLEISTNISDKKIQLQIKGVVVAKPRTAEDDYPEEAGNIRMLSRYLNFGTITTQEPVKKTFEIYNQGTSPIKFYKNKIEAPQHLRINIHPTPLAPGETGNIAINYDTQAKSDLGYLTDKIVLPTNDKADSTKVFYVSATIHQHFPEMSPQEIKNAPKIRFKSKSDDFGKIEQGKVVRTNFYFSNEGKKDLIIKALKPSCGCTASIARKKVIKSGETGSIEVRFDTKDKTGIQYQTIKVFCNDPVSPRHELKLKAKIEK